jgi:hypothetical protein
VGDVGELLDETPVTGVPSNEQRTELFDAQMFARELFEVARELAPRW